MAQCPSNVDVFVFPRCHHAYSVIPIHNPIRHAPSLPLALRRSPHPGYIPGLTTIQLPYYTLQLHYSIEALATMTVVATFARYTVRAPARSRVLAPATRAPECSLESDRLARLRSGESRRAYSACRLDVIAQESPVMNRGRARNLTTVVLVATWVDA